VVLASGGADGTVRRWDGATGAPIGEPLTGHTGWVLAVTSWVGLPPLRGRLRFRRRTSDDDPDERVASAAGREGLTQSRPVAVGAGEAVVDVDALRLDAERL
jgi:hypothetical protein